MSLTSVHRNLTKFLYNQWTVTARGFTSMQNKIQRLAVREFWLIWMEWSIRGVQESTGMSVIGYCSTLKKHVVNRNVWCSPELKHKFSPERLPNLYKMYPIITTWGAFHCVRQWTCGVRVWEKCPLHESHAECVRVGSPALVLVSYH